VWSNTDDGPNAGPEPPMHGHREGTPVRWGTVPCAGMDPTPRSTNGPVARAGPPNHRTGDTAAKDAALKNRRGKPAEPGSHHREGYTPLKQTLEDKARRYLAEHRVTTLTHTPHTITTRIRGEHGTYYVIGDEYGWTCNCPANTNHRTCSHILATETITQNDRHT
jgi:hypothetical protein